MEGGELDDPCSGDLRGISPEQLGSEGDLAPDDAGLVWRLAQQSFRNLCASIRSKVRVCGSLRLAKVDRQFSANAAAI